MFIGRFVDANGNTMKLTEEVMKKMLHHSLKEYDKFNDIQKWFINRICSTALIETKSDDEQYAKMNELINILEKAINYLPVLTVGNIETCDRGPK